MSSPPRLRDWFKSSPPSDTCRAQPVFPLQPVTLSEQLGATLCCGCGSGFLERRGVWDLRGGLVPASGSVAALLSAPCLPPRHAPGFCLGLEAGQSVRLVLLTPKGPPTRHLGRGCCGLQREGHASGRAAGLGGGLTSLLLSRCVPAPSGTSSGSQSVEFDLYLGPCGWSRPLLFRPRREVSNRCLVACPVLSPVAGDSSKLLPVGWEERFEC